MKSSILLSACCLFVSACALAENEVQIKKVEDGFRFEIDGELFTQWQTKAWKVPYLYPVIGPNGENITRHFPMRKDVEGEQKDHPHHRSIRFSHRDVNGFSFWAPDHGKKEYEAKIRLVKVEKMEGGELILQNEWLGNGEVLLTERLRLKVTALEKKQVLLDYDVELTAVNKDVVFVDEKDGGLGIRVPGWMVVTNRHTKTGTGSIQLSTGEKDGAAWGETGTVGDVFWAGSEGECGGDFDF